MNKVLPLFIFLLLLSVGCRKPKDKTGIPYYNVNIKIYTTDPQFIDLSVVGGWSYVNAGSRGILIYRSSNNDFKAFDRHCPYQPSNSCGIITVNSDNISATDTCCGSQFLITDGTVLKEPAIAPLKQYKTSFDGNILRVTN